MSKKPKLHMENAKINFEDKDVNISIRLPSKETAVSKKAIDKMKAAVQAATQQDEASTTSKKEVKETSAKLPKATAKKPTAPKVVSKKAVRPDLKPVSEISRIREVVGQAVADEEVRANAGRQSAAVEEKTTPPWEDLPAAKEASQPPAISMEPLKKAPLTQLSKKPELHVENGRISFEDAIKAAAQPRVPQAGFDVSKYLK